MVKDFSKLKDFIDELNSTNSSNDKLRILRELESNPSKDFIKQVLFYTYNPYYQFFTTSKNCKKVNLYNSSLVYGNIIDLLDDLRNRAITGHTAIAAVNTFKLKLEPELQYLVDLIIDKDLKCRISDSSINKIFPNFIPTFDVALGYPIEDCKPNFRTEKWFSSRKLDGIRVVTIIREPRDIRFYSRAGNEFFCFKKLRDALLECNLSNVVLDGEMCIMNGDLEDFKQMAREVKLKDFECENPGYRLFDLITLEEFENKFSKFTFSERLLELNILYDNLAFKHPDISKYIKVLPQTKIESFDHYTALYNEAVEAGYEGLILRKDAVYEGKRTKNNIKCKPFFDAEYEVIRIVSGPFRVIDEMTKLEREEEIMTNLFILHKGHEVSVGSGFSINERRKFHANPNEIIGKIITVQYFEESEDSNGKPSLRMPTLKYIHGDKRTI